MSIRSVWAIALVLVVGCGGGATPEPVAPDSVAPPPAGADAPAPSSLAAAPARPASPREALDAFESAIKAGDRNAALALSVGGMLEAAVNDLVEGKASAFKDDAPAERPGDGTCFASEVQYQQGPKPMTFCVSQVGGDYKISSISAQLQHATAPAPTETQPSAPPAAIEQSSEGRIVSRAKDKVTIQIDGATPAAGTKAELYRKLEQAVLFIPAGAWIGIADVTVDKVEGHKVSLTINERKSTITINGAQVDHFKPQTSIRLTWSAAP